MKFPADMDISPSTGACLQGLGHDATHLHAQGLDRLQDRAILEKARVEERVLLTHDLDQLIAASKARLPSIVILRLRDMRPDGVNARLLDILSQHIKPLEQGAVVSVAEGQIRVRLLPINRSD